MSSQGLCAIVEMSARTTKVVGRQRSIGDRIIGQEVPKMTISHFRGLKEGLLVEAMQMLVKGRRTALTMKGGLEMFKVSRGVRDNKGIKKKIEALGANGIYSKAIVQLGIIGKEIIDGTGRHGLEVVIFFGRWIGTGGGLGDTRRSGSGR